jgi:hypothetical protein
MPYPYRIFILFIVSALLFSFTGGIQKPAKSLKKSTFTENKQWELRLNERQRSGSEVRMNAPVSGSNFTENKIEFSWENGPISGKLFLGLLTNENKEVFYQEVTGNKFFLNTKEINLKPGLYYWTLESEEDVLSVGKFYFRK